MKGFHNCFLHVYYFIVAFYTDLMHALHTLILHFMVVLSLIHLHTRHFTNVTH